MLIECGECESKVDGKILGLLDTYNEVEGVPAKIILLECPVCKKAILAYQEYEINDQGNYELGGAIRLWPNPKTYVDFAIPDIVRNSLEEARKCYKSQAYNACAVMCGRSLEGICREFKLKNKLLAGGLKELRDKEIIDKRLFEWGQALRVFRNTGAHASEESVRKEDAKDLLDFANAICEYVFVLTSRFNSFMERQKDVNISK